MGKASEQILEYLQKLTPVQLEWIQKLIVCLSTPSNLERNSSSDVMTNDRAMGLFLIHLVVHHSLSFEPFKKEKLEYTLFKVLEATGRVCEMPGSRTNPGFDLQVGKERWNLKTEANEGIRKDIVEVSKWMELGKGEWNDRVEDLRGLTAQFLRHLSGYERIFTLRYLGTGSQHHYELLEIPKKLLLECESGVFEMKTDSKHKTAKPGYCRVYNADGQLRYQLYFDGGGERKLRLQKMLRSECVFHGSWRFSSSE